MGCFQGRGFFRGFYKGLLERASRKGLGDPEESMGARRLEARSANGHFSDRLQTIFPHIKTAKSFTPARPKA